MTKKRAMNEQDKINLSKGKKFSKENQPSPEAKSQGHQKRKKMREMLDYLLKKEITNKKGETATTQEAMLTALIAKAIKGDVRAFIAIRDSVGEKPTTDISIIEKPDLSQLSSDTIKRLAEKALKKENNN